MVPILPAFPAILSAFEFSVTFSAVSFKVSAASVEVRPDKYWQSCSVYINKVKKRAEREKTKTRWSVFILLFCDVTFFFLQSSKIIKMSFRERSSFLVQQNPGGWEATFQKYGNSSTNSFGGTLSLSLSLSVFVVAFHQTHLIPVKDRERDREIERQTYVSVSLSVSLSVSFVCISRREFDVSFFLREN